MSTPPTDSPRFPVHPAVNRAKSDALPSRELLLSRRDPVIATWEDLRDHYPVRFNREASSLTGASIQTEINWQNILFQRFRESVAFTAIQRGIRHWSP